MKIKESPMKKLTADECREWIDIFSELEKDDAISIAGESHLQAYRIALPILEQQERDEWIEWRGGECPVHPNLIVETKWDDGDIIIQPAGNSDWMHDSVVNIIAYRIIPERATNQNGE